MNFGHKVAIGYSLFVVFIVFLVVVSFKMDFSLESENYYEKEIAYTQEKEAIENFNALNFNFELIQGDSIKFPLPNISQKENMVVSLKRPSNKDLDLLFKIENSNNPIVLSKEKLAQGVYNLELSFDAKGKSYLIKKSVYIQP